MGKPNKKKNKRDKFAMAKVRLSEKYKSRSCTQEPLGMPLIVTESETEPFYDCKVCFDRRHESNFLEQYGICVNCAGDFYKQLPDGDSYWSDDKEAQDRKIMQWVRG